MIRKLAPLVFGIVSLAAVSHWVVIAQVPLDRRGIRWRYGESTAVQVNSESRSSQQSGV
jgi:hypothetical protein